MFVSFLLVDYLTESLIIVSAIGQKNAGQKNKRCYFSVLIFLSGIFLSRLWAAETRRTA